jgi:plasmid stabilization system protein ParE
MAKRVTWTPQAKIDRFEILEYYYKAGTPKKSLRNIDSQIKDMVKYLSEFPQLGKQFGSHNERIIYKSYYSIIYKIINEAILILQVWDTRRNPEDLKL